jgi:hypothetical protein
MSGATLAALMGLAAVLMASGCTTRTAGMQSPLAHDYDGLQWRPLDHAVVQAVTVAPAYTALVENDPSTSPDDLRSRIDGLPDDVRGSQLVEIRVLVRPLDPLVVDGKSSINVGESAGVDLASLSTDGDWRIVDDVPAAEAGQTIVIELHPGEGAAPGWEYAITPGRSPYGGEPAAVGESGERLSGALGFQTIFEQETDVGAVANDVVDAVADGFGGDPLLGLVYAVLLVGIVALVRFRGRSRIGGIGDGR